MFKQELIDRALMEMKFQVKWLEYDFIDRAFLLNLYEHFIHSNDKSTEHYRYGAFRKILQDNKYLDDCSIDNYIELAKIDEDRAMAKAALVDLFRWKGLSDEQYKKLVHSPEFASEIFQTYHRNKSMIETISKIPISDEIIEDCIQNYPANIQEYLLYKEDIKRHQLEYIYQHGTKKRIRNMAKNMLGSRRYR
ncbi:hypothetical protein [Chamaesiphon minutus]|uniref:Uncharacterized protein n=1 Tax=Chamaesiphon minutus (strain ATCC 27169 / PCC 6605) TaxID=1173020 RepID=K9UA91_CHAP6|nr:hypothetical protein [Chamaesiphon minutus]AFY91316.1 hypothetical protein Cha6605_0007 [Chamaesiphon minutus PCC 6605]